MTDETASPDRMSEVLRLCTLLADRVLDAQIMGRTIPYEQIVALARAARLLQDHDVEWPPLLTQVMHDLVEEEADTPTSDTQQSSTPAGTVAGGLSRLFTKLRPEPNQP